jgi:hypothetical protein
MAQVGYSTTTSLHFEAKGTCDADNKRLFLFGDGVHAEDAPIVYTFSYCLP